MLLRPYQTAIITDARAALQAHPAACVFAPTGAGKTVIFSSIAQMVKAKQGQTLILVNRGKLLDQTAETVSRMGMSLSVVHGQSFARATDVVLSTVQTFKNRYPQGYKANLLIVDEAHQSHFDNYVKTMLGLGVRTLGFTATPSRLDKRKPMYKVYKQLVLSAKTAELIQDGYLCQPRYFTPEFDLSQLEVDGSGEFTDESQRRTFANTESLIREYKTHAGKKGLVFVKLVQQATDIAAAFNEAGIRAAVVHGKTPDTELDRLTGLLKDGHLDCLVNADLLTFGFDLPALDTVVLFRSTTSIALMHQMIGRGSRPAPGKTEFRVLDFGGNIKRLDVWEADIDWTQHFYAHEPEEDEQGVPAMKQCPQCRLLAPVSLKSCRCCGYVWPKANKADDANNVLDQRLVEYIAMPNRQVPFEQLTIPELIQFAAAKKYKLQWVQHHLAQRPDNVKQLEEYFRVRNSQDPAKAAQGTLRHLGYLPN